MMCMTMMFSGLLFMMWIVFVFPALLVGFLKENYKQVRNMCILTFILVLFLAPLCILTI